MSVDALCLTSKALIYVVFFLNKQGIKIGDNPQRSPNKREKGESTLHLVNPIVYL